MAAPASFDPLFDLDGLWTTDLAERYLPIPGMPPAKYECVDGRLILSPYEAAPNTYAVLRYALLNDAAARKADLRVYSTVNLRINLQRWLQPDLIVVRKPLPGVWVDAADAVVVGEFVSPSSRKRDRIDKPALCAKAGVPYYLYGEADLRRRFASVRLSRLEHGEYVTIAEAVSGQRFETAEPFPMSFDPIELLDL